MAKGKGTFKVGRSARSGRFITVKAAQANKGGAVVETMKKK